MIPILRFYLRGARQILSQNFQKKMTSGDSPRTPGAILESKVMCEIMLAFIYNRSHQKILRADQVIAFLVFEFSKKRFWILEIPYLDTSL